MLFQNRAGVLRLLEPTCEASKPAGAQAYRIKRRGPLCQRIGQGEKIRLSLRGTRAQLGQEPLHLGDGPAARYRTLQDPKETPVTSLETEGLGGTGHGNRLLS
jgi:hypothetical protein